jgi:hypothetical protein
MIIEKEGDDNKNSEMKKRIKRIISNKENIYIYKV